MPTETGAEAAAAPSTPAAAASAPAGAPAELSPAACAALLAELFPALFAAGRVLPLKLRIQADIQQRAPGRFTRRTLSAFLHRHTNSTAYLKALVQRPQRHGLDGAPAGEVDPVHRDAAAAELERRRALFEARRAAERAAAAEARRQAEAAARARNAAEDDARRERAALLRAYETTTLTRANFCALKGIAESELDARLHQAWLEREQRAMQPRPPPQRPAPQPPRGDQRPPRQPRPPAAAGAPDRDPQPHPRPRPRHGRRQPPAGGGDSGGGSSQER